MCKCGAVSAIFRREMKGYFSSPVAYVFLIAFLVLTGFLTFVVTGFYEGRQANLSPFFFWHPWVYLLLVPAATMGSWAEERRTGTSELLLTLPVTLWQVLLGKFLAAWAFLTLALALTFPVVWTTRWLGSPDTGVILSGYLGSFLLSGACVAIGIFASALSRSQVIGFVIGLGLCLFLLLIGFEPVGGALAQWGLPQVIVDALLGCSLLTHYQAMQLGMIDLADAGYYLGVMVFFLAAAHAVIDRRQSNRPLMALLTLALLVCVIGGINITLRNFRLRADLTENRLYTLSDGTRAILGKIEQPCTVKFYFSKQDKNTPVFLRNYAAQVADLLKEYQRAAKGKIILEQYDVTPDSDAEEWAQRYGIEPQGAGRGSLPVYFGLVVVPFSGREAVLPAFSPVNEGSLEYDVTRLITRAVWPKKPVIGVMNSFGDILGGAGKKKGWVVFEELKKDYALQAVESTIEKIPEEIAALIVIHPKNLSDAALLAIDQFVLRGGRLIACVDPLSELEHSMAASESGREQPGPSTLGKLFDAWGVGFDPAMVTVDEGAVTLLRAQNGAQEKNPVFLSLKKDNMVSTELLTSRLSMVMLPYAGAFGESAADGLALTPLMRSSADASASVAAQTILYGGLAAVRAQAKPDGKARTLAAKLTGSFKTAFPENEGLKEGRSSVFLFADADFLYDSFCVAPLNMLGATVYRPINENLVLFANVLEQAAGMPELVGIRTRGTFSRPFARVDALEREAAQAWQKKEQDLSAKLQATQQKIAELQRQKQGDDRLILSPEQQQQIEAFKAERTRTTAELKEVRRNLNREVEALGLRLKILNILAIPVLVALAGLVYGICRKRKAS